MILTILREKAGMLAFGLAAFFAPLSTFIPASCGVACGGCPLGGGCLAIPVVAAGIGAFSCRSRILALFGRITGKAL
ncbi:MAG: hypothetical protein PHF57_08595 [Methanoregula sp.]|jgi:hypothetical protein|nr:hypothetical protein [Methanoregula sp.]